MAKPIERRDHCCLCRKTKEQVQKLIVGLDGAVCSDCIDLCNDILHNDKSRVMAPPGDDWDGKVMVAAEDRDVYPDSMEARRALNAMAALIRNYVTKDPGNEPG
jgi:ATP-dependent protease Clp ATPase subunit